MVELFKSSIAYKIIAGDKKKGFLSHAYMLVCDDAVALPIYLKTVAKTIACESETYCGECRYCRLIEKGTHFDVTTYPKGDAKKILVADVDELVAQTYVKPIEGEKRIFILNNAESMNASSQNKLLKTLEEPPKGVYILLGVTNENAMLSTVKSRVKKLEIPPFSEEQLFNAFKNECVDETKLRKAVTLSDGKAGMVSLLYDQDEIGCDFLVNEVLINMKTSRDLLTYSSKLNKENLRDFLLSLKKTMQQIIYAQSGKTVDNDVIGALCDIYPIGAALGIINKINQSESALFYNGNVNMIADGILLSVLEEKYKWKKL